MVQQIIFENKLDTFVIGFTELVSPALKLAAQGALWGAHRSHLLCSVLAKSDVATRDAARCPTTSQ